MINLERASQDARDYRQRRRRRPWRLQQLRPSQRRDRRQLLDELAHERRRGLAPQAPHRELDGNSVTRLRWLHFSSDMATPTCPPLVIRSSSGSRWTPSARTLSTSSWPPCRASSSLLQKDTDAISQIRFAHVSHARPANRAVDSHLVQPVHAADGCARVQHVTSTTLQLLQKAQPSHQT